LAAAFKAQGQPREAIATYEKILEGYPDHMVTLNNLADLYTEQEPQLDRALELAQRAAERAPDDGTVQDTLGWVWYHRGHYDEAVACLQKAVRLSPDQGLLHYHLGQALWAVGRKKEAADALRAALARTLPTREKKEAKAALAACEKE
jgi:tetratricopeptide (TPR) repeat protein